MQGFAYLEFESEAGLEQAIALNGSELNSKRISVAQSAPPGGGRGRGRGREERDRGRGRGPRGRTRDFRCSSGPRRPAALGCSWRMASALLIGCMHVPGFWHCTPG